MLFIYMSISNCSEDSSMTRESLAAFVVVMDGVLFNNCGGMAGMFRGGVWEIGEFRKFIKKARSYTIRVPPGVVE